MCFCWWSEFLNLTLSSSVSLFSAGAPGAAPAQGAEEAPFPGDAEGAEFFKKGKKGDAKATEKVVKKKKVFAKPQTLVAALFRFKVWWL
jgi:hypothetical protein